MAREIMSAAGSTCAWPLPHRGRGAYLTAKRAIDVVLASLLLLLCSPLVLLLALLVRLDSPGPALFRRRVVGRHGRSFDMLKLRTMVEGAESILEYDQELKRAYLEKCKLEHDPRVTRIGAILRKTSLDELPQLVNVLQGTMSLVGPRPIHEEEIGIYGPDVVRFASVTPGITGLWQICGRSDTTYERRVALDMAYIERRGLLLDLSILARTALAVLHADGAC